MNFIPMVAHETRVYLPSRIGGFDLYQCFVRWNAADEKRKEQEATAAKCAAFIATACNAHEQLVAALQKIAAAEMDEGGCYYTNRENILTARRALKEAGIQK